MASSALSTLNPVGSEGPELAPKRRLLDLADRFDGVPTKVEPAPLLGEHTTEVLSDWLGLEAAAVAQLRQDGIV
jgi:crotonobetainyl-CoA:carnitine CoA-transferase CaiB-like acyl-CoA transferase